MIDSMGGLYVTDPIDYHSNGLRNEDYVMKKNIAWEYISVPVNRHNPPRTGPSDPFTLESTGRGHIWLIFCSF